MNIEEEKNRLNKKFEEGLADNDLTYEQRIVAFLIKGYSDQRLDLLERDLNSKIQALKRDSSAPHTKR